MKSIGLSFFGILLTALVFGQTPTNISVTNPTVDAILKGNYNPTVYAPGQVVNHSTVVAGLQNNINPDSLKSSILKLATFKNRNTGADTVSAVIGIGAARRWVYSKFEDFSTASGGRLIPSYLQFNQSICGQNQHRNIFATLPGTDTADKSVIIIEVHIDSRCKDLCDTACVAEGIEDNATGTALVMELARTMSAYTFKNTIVFLVVIGEEQGLYGGNAFALYCKNSGIKVKAVLNNDVIGGIICGKTSSSPSCPGLNDIDSTQVRLFSSGSAFSDHKNLVRFIKLEYQEELLPMVLVPMQISVMTAEDRFGRGGDHKPFREQGFTAMRFTSANEHGDASNGAGYTDRQHTSDDILGIDTNSDAVIDSFFVDFNYLGRNAAINGNAAAMAAIGPDAPTFNLSQGTSNTLKVNITSEFMAPQYRIGVRTGSNTDFDTIRTITASMVDSFAVSFNKSYFISVAAVDENGVESLFATEQRLSISNTGINDLEAQGNEIELLQNTPNPFDEATAIGFIVPEKLTNQSAYISIVDLQGREVKRLPVVLKSGMNEVVYEHGYNATGVFTYQLVIAEKVMASKRMVFTAN